MRNFAGPYFPAFALNTERYSVSLRIQSNYGKYGPEKLQIRTLLKQYQAQLMTPILLEFKRSNKSLYLIHWKGYYSFNTQSVCDYKYCFFYVFLKWTGSVHDSRIFLSSSINDKFCNETIPLCKKEIVQDMKKVPVCLV